MRILYFIEAGADGPIKIGVTDNIAKRMRQLDNGCPFELRLLAKFPGDEWHEQAIHRRFSSLRIKGEWFTAAPEIYHYIERCRAADFLVEIQNAETTTASGLDDVTVMYLETCRDYLFLVSPPHAFEDREDWIARAAGPLGISPVRAWSIFYRKARCVTAHEFDNMRDSLGIARLGQGDSGDIVICNAEGNETGHLGPLSPDNLAEIQHRIVKLRVAIAEARSARRCT